LPGRPIERGEKVIASRVDLTAAEGAQFLPDGRPEAVENVAPGAIPTGARSRSRADNIGEQQGSEHPIRPWIVGHAGQEALDLIEHRLGVADPTQVVLAR
jgi:hypothetical protein